MLETKCIKRVGKSQFSLSFLFSTVNDVRRKLYTVVKHSTEGKRAKRMPDTTVETTNALKLYFFLGSLFRKTAAEDPFKTILDLSD